MVWYTPTISKGYSLLRQERDNGKVSTKDTSSPSFKAWHSSSLLTRTWSRGCMAHDSAWVLAWPVLHVPATFWSKPPWWHSQSLRLCISPTWSSLPIALLLQGGSRAKEYVRYIPDICPNDSEAQKEYIRHIPDIWVNASGRASESISQAYTRHHDMTKWLGKHMTDIYQTYSTRHIMMMTQCQCVIITYHRPGIYHDRNMYEILHNWYIPRISNFKFYRFQMSSGFLPTYDVVCKTYDIV